MSTFRKLAPVVALLTAVSFAATPADAAKGRKAKLAAGVVAGVVAAGAIAAIANSNNKAQAGYNGYGYNNYGSPVYSQVDNFGYGAPAPHSYGYVTQHRAPAYYVEESYAAPAYGYNRRAVSADKAINGCSRAGRKLYGFRHGRLDHVTSVETVGRGLFRVEGYGTGYYGPQSSQVVCVSDSRGNVRDFAVY